MKPIYYVLDLFSLVTASGESLHVDLHCYFISQENRDLKDLGHTLYSQLLLLFTVILLKNKLQNILYYFATCFFTQRGNPILYHVYDQKTSKIKLECIQVHFITNSSLMTFLAFASLMLQKATAFLSGFVQLGHNYSDSNHIFFPFLFSWQLQEVQHFNISQASVAQMFAQ